MLAWLQLPDIILNVHLHRPLGPKLAATDRACSWLVAHQLVEHLHLQVVSLLPSFSES
jgi:hypothetical protein